MVSAEVAALSFPIVFVLSLYNWTAPERIVRRDDPAVVRMRIWRSLVACGACTCLLLFVFRSPFVFHAGGWRAETAAVAFSATHAMLLFAGPMYAAGSTPWHIVAETAKSIPRSVHALRDVVIGPLAEEWVFRACLLSFLQRVDGTSSTTALVLISAAYFGLAHVHLVLEHVVLSKTPLLSALPGMAFHVSFTSLYGAYAAWLYISTGGSFLAAAVSHALCNCFGFPDVEAALHHPRRLRVAAVYLLGILLFYHGFSWLPA